MTGRAVKDARLFAPRKMVVQALGFVVGVALLGWCIALAVKGEGWEKILHADPRLVVGLGACTVVSMFVNGTIFWLIIRPVRLLDFWDMQRLNLVTAVLNYAPIRLGLIARVAYHLKVDRMPLLQIGAWFAALTFMLVLTLGACVVATIARPEFDVWWFALVAGQIVVGGVITIALMGQPLIARYGRGLDKMLRVPSCLWGGMLLRLVDIAAFSGRMAFAAAILDLGLDIADTLLLGFAALFMSLNPLGRMGYREVTVAFVASTLVLTEDQIDQKMATLALVESAGEALVAIPLGSACLLWYRARWRASGAARGGEVVTPQGERVTLAGDGETPQPPGNPSP